MHDAVAWQAAEVSTNDFAGKLFTLGDNRIYGGARNCPLKLEKSYEIVIIVTEKNLSEESIMFTKSIRINEVSQKHHEWWIILIILFVIVAGAAYYLYQRKRQKSTEQPMHDEIILSQNVENYKQETMSAISNSKQKLSTSSDRQFLSQASTAKMLPLTVEKKDVRWRRK